MVISLAKKVEEFPNLYDCRRIKGLKNQTLSPLGLWERILIYCNRVIQIDI